jgi:hypothetical protein
MKYCGFRAGWRCANFEEVRLLSVELVVVETSLDMSRNNAVAKTRDRGKHLPEHKGSVRSTFQDSFKRRFVVASNDASFFEVGLRVEAAEADRRRREKQYETAGPEIESSHHGQPPRKDENLTKAGFSLTHFVC